MRFVDAHGDPVKLGDLEPWCHFAEYDDGTKYPIMRVHHVTQSPNRLASVKIEWDERYA